MDSKTEWWPKLPVQKREPSPDNEPLTQELSQADETTRKWIARYLYLADFLLSSEESEAIGKDESTAA